MCLSYSSGSFFSPAGGFPFGGEFPPTSSCSGHSLTLHIHPASLSAMGDDWLRSPWQIKTNGKYFLSEALWIGCEVSTLKSDRSSYLTRFTLLVQRLSLSPCLLLTYQAYQIRLQEAEERAREGEAFRDIILLPKAQSDKTEGH